jgi:pimeloyl-ACP methyl ester carboxylesterase
MIASCLVLKTAPRTTQRRLLWPIVLCLAFTATGCMSSGWIRQRSEPALPFAVDLGLYSWHGPQATPRTAQLLRRFDLLEEFERRPQSVLGPLLENPGSRSSPELVFAIAELGFIAGRLADRERRFGDALDLYSISVAHAYSYLLNDQLQLTRNPYDPQYRQACDLYNAALESALRVVAGQGALRPGTAHLIVTRTQEYELHIVSRGPWHPGDLHELKFVSDYRLQGLTNHYRTFGLGVPLIGVHHDCPGNCASEPYHAPGMSVPVTAFLRVLPESQVNASTGCVRHICILELHDPLQSMNVSVNGRLVPLETDLSTPLAYSLNDPAFRQANVATRGLLNPAKSQEHQGLYLLEPYDPEKIPVLMVHGLWSNLVTWMEMFNDLRGIEEIRDHYQFWFYLYPSGQPLLLTATQLRQELDEARRVLDPEGTNPTLKHMVLVGHSMGGLVARLQTLESGEDYWNVLSDTPLDELDAPASIKSELRMALYFHPDPAVKRVVTIASPHRGSAYSNSATQWLGRRLIQLPEMLVRTRQHLLLANRSAVRKQGILEIETSIDSLSPTSPILEVMQRSQPAPWVRYHNIIGVVPEGGWLAKIAGESDGVVKLESARLAGAASELMVEADHINVHRHPRTVLEVQRILLEHLEHTSRMAMQRLPAPTDHFLPKDAARDDVSAAH